MKTHFTHADNDSDFGPTVPGQRWGEGSGSILPYLANSLKVNPNAGALPLARQSRAGSKGPKKGPAQPPSASPMPPMPPKPGKPVR
jgi:hypothetical protein